MQSLILTVANTDIEQCYSECNFSQSMPDKTEIILSKQEKNVKIRLAEME